MDLSPRCGARTRNGTPRRSPAMANGRYRMPRGKPLSSRRASLELGDPGVPIIARACMHARRPGLEKGVTPSAQIAGYHARWRASVSSGSRRGTRTRASCLRFAAMCRSRTGARGASVLVWMPRGMQGHREPLEPVIECALVSGL
jgi:hypothetical protein